VDAEVEYGALTDDGLLREAVFKGLRDDLVVRKVKAPRLAPSSTGRSKLGVPRENILQLLPDATVPSKEELDRYWTRLWKKALPHLGHRPLKLVRHVHGTTFYHKGPLPRDIPPGVHQLRIQKREGGEGTRLWVDSLDGFLGVVEIGAVELHPWNSTVRDVEHADRIVIDLDPGEGIEWQDVVETALDLRAMMRCEGLQTWPKLTGGKGIHLMAPVDAPVWHDKAHRLAHAIADYNDMIYAATCEEIETRRKAFIRKWRLKHRAIADSLQEAGDRLFSFTRLPPSQWKSARTTNAIERLHEEFKRRIKDADRAAISRHCSNVVLGLARFWPDQHEQGRWLENPRHKAHRSAN
jgi:DNA ligase D-like protein (predicted polymerase)